MSRTADPLARLTEALQRLPGIGAKTAQRLAFHVLKMPKEQIEALAAALMDVKQRVAFCSVCCNITETDPCALCDDAARDRTLICVVEDPANLAAIERTGRFRGLYHVLHGALSPMHGIGPDQLRINELMKRLDGVEEVILATNPNSEGEATAVYVTGLLRPRGIRASRIGMGLPVGSELDYADDVTIVRALEGRRNLQ